MTRRGLAAAAAVAVALGACGGDDGGGGDDEVAIDAPTGSPDAPTIDADPNSPDANPNLPDAAMSNVTIVDCTGVSNPFVLTTSGFAFSPSGDISLPVDGVVQFSTTGFHNFASAAGVPPEKRFRSGAVGHNDTVCLRFTVAETYPFVCEAHISMNGNVVVQ